MKSLTEKQRVVLSYIEDYPGCSTTDIARAMGWHTGNTMTVAGSLYADRRVERYAPLTGRESMHPRWYPKTTVNASA